MINSLGKMKNNLNVIEVKNIRKKFTSGFFKKKVNTALNGISLTVNKGEIFGLLGPNGAGKTTLLNVISTQLLPDAGKVLMFGRETTKLSMHELATLKARINMCSGNPNFPWSLTVQEILKYYSMLYGFGIFASKDRVHELISAFELEKHRNSEYSRLSTGTKQRVALAKSMINAPEILLLDEPTIGLDPDISKKIRAKILEINKKTGTTIILTTHYMKEAEELCGRIAFIKDGKIKALGTKAELKRKTKTKDLEGVFLDLAK
jgi:ABC-2 type transport system ATP-binding protein